MRLKLQRVYLHKIQCSTNCTLFCYSKLSEGDSGIIVSFRDKNGRLHPVGMFVGVFSEDLAALGCPIYQAIILSQAIKDLETDYPHHIADVRVLATC